MPFLNWFEIVWWHLAPFRAYRKGQCIELGQHHKFEQLLNTKSEIKIQCVIMLSKRAAYNVNVWIGFSFCIIMSTFNILFMLCLWYVDINIYTFLLFMANLFLTNKLFDYIFCYTRDVYTNNCCDTKYYRCEISG